MRPQTGVPGLAGRLRWLSLGVAVACPAAAETVWLGPAGVEADALNPTNWDAGLPQPGDTARIDGDGIALLAGGSLSADLWMIGNLTGGELHVGIDGVLAAAAGGQTTIALGPVAGSTGRLRVDGGIVSASSLTAGTVGPGTNDPIPNPGVGRGVIELLAGRLDVDALRMDGPGSGFTQSGGWFTAGDVDAGDTGGGQWSVTGGTFKVHDTFTLRGGAPGGAVSRFEVTGADVDIRRFHIDEAFNAEIVINQANLHVGSDLDIGGSGAVTFTAQGSTINADQFNVWGPGPGASGVGTGRVWLTDTDLTAEALQMLWQGEVVQTGGVVRATLSISMQAGGQDFPPRYTLNSGRIEAGVLNLGVGTATGAPKFRQLGGVVELDEWYVGTSASVPGGTYELAGGTLHVREWFRPTGFTPAALDMAGSGARLELGADGWVDFAKFGLSGSGNGTFAAGDNAVVVVPEGQSLAGMFGTVEADDAIVFIHGQDWIIPAGKTLDTFWSPRADERVWVDGVLRRSLDALPAGFYVGPTGVIDLPMDGSGGYIAPVENVSIIDGGLVRARRVSLPDPGSGFTPDVPAEIDHRDGTVLTEENLLLETGRYTLRGGLLDTPGITNRGADLFVTGGTLQTADLAFNFQDDDHVLHQTGGTIRGLANLTGIRNRATYRLSSGQLQTDALGVAGTTVLQEGGTALIDGELRLGDGNVFDPEQITGRYQLAGGHLLTGQTVTALAPFGNGAGRFTHTGGSHTTDHLHIAAGAYAWTGGTLDLRRRLTLDTAGTLDFGGQPGTLGGTNLLVWLNGNVVGPEQFNLDLGPGSLLLYRSGRVTPDNFASFSSEGVVGLIGVITPIEADQHVRIAGVLDQPFTVLGSLTAIPNENLNLTGRLRIEGGWVDLGQGTLTARNAGRAGVSGITAGRLDAGNLLLASARWEHQGGAARVRSVDVQSGGVLLIEAGTFESSTGTVVHSGGRVDVDGGTYFPDDLDIATGGVVTVGSGARVLGQLVLAGEFAWDTSADIEFGRLEAAATGRMRPIYAGPAGLGRPLHVDVADLAGAIDLTGLPTDAAVGDELTLIEINNDLTGTFDQVNNADRGGGTRWVLRYTELDYPLDAIVTAALILSGDFNASGQVEQGDLDLVLSNWGYNPTSTGESSGGAPPGWIVTDELTGPVDQSELDQVLANWGAAGAPDFRGTHLPEPAGVAMSVILLGAAAGRRRVRIG